MVRVVEVADRFWLVDIMLFFMATRDMSSVVVLRVSEVLRVGEEVVSRRFDVDGGLEIRRLLGDVDV